MTDFGSLGPSSLLADQVRWSLIAARLPGGQTTRSRTIGIPISAGKLLSQGTRPAKHRPLATAVKEAGEGQRPSRLILISNSVSVLPCQEGRKKPGGLGENMLGGRKENAAANFYASAAAVYSTGKAWRLWSFHEVAALDWMRIGPYLRHYRAVVEEDPTRSSREAGEREVRVRGMVWERERDVKSTRNCTK
ncbi:hypothetical protein HPP92_012720 [Vanilla planifolia]|uniref:Uncharacterized protein n=1 Tax=Vanilla planifolia TaxID=51239 RepID=A0A835QNL1_VANPL|nr:hypothetical protein HPP92_012720 [Vanilla planifolia]